MQKSVTIWQTLKNPLQTLEGQEIYWLEKYTWKSGEKPWIAGGRGEGVGGAKGGEVGGRRSEMGEVGEVRPREQRWRRVGHLTGGGAHLG